MQRVARYDSTNKQRPRVFTLSVFCYRGNTVKNDRTFIKDSAIY
ncbi:hypothetical protein HMPREF9065_00208 [Aggregatibacter sp. oral taxon 458 str. W10330]|nr:hypothetical protein HMPREF9065_00208 [Aggregatibacter sp. oral taxon 458 str. W10330]